MFLSSSFADVSALFANAIKDEMIGKKVTFIPTASIHEEVTFYVDAGKEALKSHGLIIDELEISTATKDEIQNKLLKNEYIYISGGNTFFLLKEMKRTGTDKILIEQVSSGKLYIGESAGAIILSPNIEYAKEMDDYKAVDLESYDSLNLINFYPLPHYKDFPFQEITEKIVSKLTEKINLCPFSNTQAIVVHGNEYNAVNN